MKKETFERICKEQNIDAKMVLYNIEWELEDLKVYKNKVYKPCWFINGKPYYQYNKKCLIDLQYYI